MDHIKALLYKFLTFLAVYLVILGFIYGVNFGDIFAISILMSIAAYLLGDLLILPYFGNTAATIADLGFVYLGTWLLGNIYIEEPIRLGVASFLSAIAIAVCEVFFHRYMTKNVLAGQQQNKNKDYRTNRPAYDTEFAEENDLDEDEKNSDPEE